MKDGVAQRRAVTIGLEDGGRVEIVSGLVGTEQIVAAGAASLQDGQRVTVPDGPSTASPKP